MSGDRPDDLQDSLASSTLRRELRRRPKIFLMFELVAAVRLCRQSRTSSLRPWCTRVAVMFRV